LNFDGKFTHYNRQFFWFYPSSYNPIIQNKIQMKEIGVARIVLEKLGLLNWQGDSKTPFLHFSNHIKFFQKKRGYQITLRACSASFRFFLLGVY